MASSIKKTVELNNMHYQSSLIRTVQKTNSGPRVKEETKYEIDPSRHSSKKCGIVKAYAANTHHGLYRNYNEDRVSIILNISKPLSKEGSNWPKCSFFAVYDGHGGSSCADFLKDFLHQFIIKDP